MSGYPATRTFWLEPTDQVAAGLRRYSRGQGFTCETGYHQALVYTHLEPARFYEGPHGRRRSAPQEVAHDDPRWPRHCAHCTYEFTDGDVWQPWDELVWRRTDTGEQRVLHQNAPATELGVPSAEPGACWNAWWMPSSWRRGDGIYLMVRLPNGHDWAVDSEASNCTRKGQPHECWVRHGDPRECRVTVDKNGDTCAAGAGSIQGGDYHGFLRNGELTAG